MSIPMLGLLLAGGLSRRMGGEDKAVATIGGQTFVQRALERLQGQVGSVLLNSNRNDLSHFNPLGVEILPDSLGGFLGPLSGILTGLEWARAKAGDEALVLSVAVDCPFFPLDLGARLAAALSSRRSVVIARSGGRAHPVFGLWSVQMVEELRAYLTTTTNRKMMDWVMAHDPIWVDWRATPLDPFMNINTPDELRALASDETLGLNS